MKAKAEKLAIREIKKKTQAVLVKAHFLSKEYQKQIQDLPTGATIGPMGQAITARLVSAISMQEYCSCVLQELEMLEKA